jgi:hypothetical protein
LRVIEGRVKKMVAAEFGPIHEDLREWRRHIDVRVSGVSQKVSGFLVAMDDEDTDE